MADLDDLLTPTLTGQRAPQREGGLPWRLGSQVYVAFFGGVMAVTAIAYYNARRLGLKGKALALILVTGAVGLVAALVAVGLIGGEGSAARLPARVVALAAYGVLYLIQRRADRIYHYHSRLDDPYESLFRPGLIAVFSVGILEAVLIFAVREATA